MFGAMGYLIRNMIEHDRTTFVMDEIHFRFVGPVAYGERVKSNMILVEIGNATLHWDCRAVITEAGTTITEGRPVKRTKHSFAAFATPGTSMTRPAPPPAGRLLRLWSGMRRVQYARWKL